MSTRRAFCLQLVTLPLVAKAAPAPAAPPPGPLASWNDGAAKRAILEFVQKTVDPGSRDFIAPAEWIAAFDNDGTLWVEKPLPNEVYFTLARVKAMAAKDPSLAAKQPCKAALEGDAAYFYEAGTSAVLELLDYVRSNGYQTWICSGGDTDFMRVFTPRVYGIPADRVIGSEFKRETRVDGDRVTIWRLPQVQSLNDKAGKPLGLDARIGKRPALVAGNVLSGGDIAMMEYSKSRNGASLQLLVNHDDAEREVRYEEKDGAWLAAARAHGFQVVSMAKGWNTIFRDDSSAAAPSTPPATPRPAPTSQPAPAD